MRVRRHPGALSDVIEPGKGYTVRAGEPWDIGDIQVTPFDLTHDAAEPMGLPCSPGATA